jgi:hypothetical protein
VKKWAVGILNEKAKTRRRKAVKDDENEENTHSEMQYHLARLGNSLGYKVWIAPNDHVKQRYKRFHLEGMFQRYQVVVAGALQYLFHSHHNFEHGMGMNSADFIMKNYYNIEKAVALPSNSFTDSFTYLSGDVLL